MGQPVLMTVPAAGGPLLQLPTAQAGKVKHPKYKSTGGFCRPDGSPGTLGTWFLFPILFSVC